MALTTNQLVNIQKYMNAQANILHLGNFNTAFNKESSNVSKAQELLNKRPPLGQLDAAPVPTTWEYLTSPTQGLYKVTLPVGVCLAVAVYYYYMYM
jgi:hypothetical protein